MNSKANTTQVGGTHYQAPYQHWDFVINCLDGRYLEGCITKYVSRHRKKNGLQDLEKALHYTDKLMERFKDTYATKPLVAGDWRGSAQSPAHFCDVNELGTAERQIILDVASWCEFNDLEVIRRRINALIEQERYRLAEPGEDAGRGYVAQGRDPA